MFHFRLISSHLHPFPAIQALHQFRPCKETSRKDIIKMHSRHRIPGGGGVRPNSMGGIGGLAASRISPETSLPRSFTYNRSSSFGGGGRMPPPKPPQPAPLPQPRKAEILMEAGRLATEYLISQGVLPPNVLSERWPTGTSRNNQSLELQLAADGRPSALARLGNGDPDDAFKNRARGRKRMGPIRDYDYEWGKDNRRNGLLYEKAQNSPDMDSENDFSYGQLGREERQGDMDFSGIGALKAIGNDFSSKSHVAANLEIVPHNYVFSNDTGSKASTSSIDKDLPPGTEPEASNVSDDMKISNMETDEVKECTSNDGLDKQSALEDLGMHGQQLEGDIDNVSKNGNGLLRLCGFAKVPTKARSSLTIKGSKVETISMTKEESALDIYPHEIPKVSADDSSESLSKPLLTTQTQDSKCLASDSRGPSAQNTKDPDLLGSALEEERVEFASSQSFSGGSVTHQQVSGQSLSELGKMNSMVKERGEKRTLQDDGTREESKKPREWTSTMVANTEEYFPLHKFSADTSYSQHNTASNVEVIEVDEERLFNVSILPRNESNSGTEPKEEKQLFPNSFRICDLNLMESSDMTGTHGSDSVYGIPTTSEAKKGVQVDVDLSISNSCNKSDDHDRSAAEANDAVVVEVDDDSAKEDEDFNTSEKRSETAHSSLESFPSQMDSTGDLPDGQDGYGLMISELLGADIPNCSSVPADITSLHGQMGLHNGEEMFDADDPIYLSLGEIPISMPDI